MKTSTKAALLALAAALVEDRDAQDQLHVYGRLAEHLATKDRLRKRRYPQLPV